MQLLNHVDEIPLLRIDGEPAGKKAVSLIILAQALPELPLWLKERKNLRIGHLFIPNLPSETPISLNFPASHGEPQIVCGMRDLEKLPEDEDIVYFNPVGAIWQELVRQFPELATRKIYLAGKTGGFERRKALPGFLNNNMPELEHAYETLADFVSRHVFASRIRALLTGDPGYLHLAPFPEYEYPQIGPEAGDIMIDGGVSDMVWAQEKFCGQVGEKGQIHGFEPIGWMAEKAAAQLAKNKNYFLHKAGLAESDGNASFVSLRDSSHIGSSNSVPTEICKLVSIDNFVASQKLERVDCIKLDVEGGELGALKGAKDVITAYKPKLIVCLYHKPQDLFEIPLYIKSLYPSYELYLAHSSCGFTDTILYSSIKN